MVIQLEIVYLTFVSTLVFSHLPVYVVVQVKCSFYPDFAVEGRHTSCKKSLTLCHQKLTVVAHTV
jgi:hypothetical protein